jgi:cyclophilin family peptidyl-prolyl cis-trans isomerase
MIGHGAHALGIAHGGTAEFLDQECHGAKRYRPSGHQPESLVGFRLMATTSNRRKREQARDRASKAKASKQAQTKRRQRLVALAIVLVVVLSTFGAFFGATQSDSSKSSTTSTTAASSVTTIAKTGITPAAAEPGASISGPTPCPAEDGSSVRTTMFAEAPPTCIDPGFFYIATIETTEGPLTIQLNPVTAPVTVNAFVVLARYHYYDGQPITSILPRQSFGFGNDFNGPTKDTAPGFTIPDEPSAQGRVSSPGAIAMTGTPGSAGTNRGSILIATFDQAPAIDPSVATFGLMLDGDNTLSAINAFASESGEPTSLVTITSISIRKSSPIPG